MVAERGGGGSEEEGGSLEGEVVEAGGREWAAAFLVLYDSLLSLSHMSNVNKMEALGFSHDLKVRVKIKQVNNWVKMGFVFNRVDTPN